MKAQLHLATSEMSTPRYRINPGVEVGAPFAVLELGPLVVFMGSPAELRRLADVCANAADVLEEAQAARAKASKCCPAELHDAMRANNAVWSGLEHVGYQDDGDGGRLELRNCWCGGTLSRPVVEAGGLAVAR